MSGLFVGTVSFGGRERIVAYAADSLGEHRAVFQSWADACAQSKALSLDPCCL